VIDGHRRQWLWQAASFDFNSGVQATEMYGTLSAVSPVLRTSMDWQLASDLAEFRPQFFWQSASVFISSGVHLTETTGTLLVVAPVLGASMRSQGPLVAGWIAVDVWYCQYWRPGPAKESEANPETRLARRRTLWVVFMGFEN
jgi:hypothetical protein